MFWSYKLESSLWRTVYFSNLDSNTTSPNRKNKTRNILAKPTYIQLDFSVKQFTVQSWVNIAIWSKRKGSRVRVSEQKYVWLVKKGINSAILTSAYPPCIFWKPALGKLLSRKTTKNQRTQQTHRVQIQFRVLVDFEICRSSSFMFQGLCWR